LAARYPELGLSFINRGVSGDRTRELVARWDRDCLALKPDLVSILIGVNNTWRRFDSGDATSVDAFYEEYRSILLKTKEMVGDNLVLCEPFILPYPEDRKRWREDLDPKIGVVRALAAELGATYVPFDGVFAAASTRVRPAYWAADGVHPTPAGHALMADAWVRHVVG
jgi:lysophospholipase L1-like esterase